MSPPSPPGRQEELLEFFRLPSPAELIAFPARDTDDRPCGEANAPEGTRGGCPFEMRESRYPGSRYGKLMNVSALKYVSRDWEALVADVTWLRAEYLRRQGGTGFSLWRLWHFARLVSALPAYLLRRATQPVPDGQLPAHLTGLFKTMQGIAVVAEHMMMRGGDLEASPGKAEFLAYTDAHGLFTNQPQGRTCAGPPHLVEEFVSVLLEGRGGGAPAPSAGTASLQGELDAFFAYGEACVSLLLSGLLFRVQAQVSLEQLRQAALGAGASELAGRLTEAAESWAQLAPRMGAPEAGMLRPLLCGLLSQPLQPLLASESASPLHRALAMPEAPQVDGARLQSVLERVGPRARDMAPELLSVAVSHLLDSHLLEHGALALFELGLGAARAALGRQPHSPGLTLEDLSRVYPPTARTLVGSWLGVEVLQEAGREDVG